MLRFADIMLGQGGTPRCRHCHTRTAPSFRDAAAIIQDIRMAADGWTSGPGPNVALTATEPLAHPSIAEILSACAKTGIERLRLDSDAAAFASPGVAKRAIEGGVRHLRFPLLGSTSRQHDALLGATGAFEATLRGVASFAAAASEAAVVAHISAAVPICRHNLGDVPSIVARAAEAGAAQVRASIADGRLELPVAAPWISTACDTGVLNATWVEVEGVPVCHSEGWELHLASNYRDVVGAKGAACAACPLEQVCGGAAPGASHAVTSALRPPPPRTQTRLPPGSGKASGRR